MSLLSAPRVALPSLACINSLSVQIICQLHIDVSFFFLFHKFPSRKRPDRDKPGRVRGSYGREVARVAHPTGATAGVR